MLVLRLLFSALAVLLSSSLPVFGSGAVATPLSATVTLRPTEPVDRQWTIVLPDTVTPRLAVTASGWYDIGPARPADTLGRDTAVILRQGRFGGQPVVVVLVRPYRVVGGRLQLPASYTLTASWKTPMTYTGSVPRLAAWLPEVLNPGYAAPVRAKGTPDTPQRLIPPTTWVEPAYPAVRLRTASDGIAMARAIDILAIDGRLANSPLADLVMFHDGAEVPIAIDDADGSSSLTVGDQILWRGSHAYGDSTWYSMDDTMSVYFLTVRPGVSHRRLGTWAAAPQTSIDRLWLDRHVELDTGFYHLGSGQDYGEAEYYSGWARFEGYYWDVLTPTRIGSDPALGKTVTQHVEVVNPIPDAVPFSVTMGYNTLVDGPQDIEHRAALAVNGQAPVFRESGGLSSQTLTMELSPEQAIVGRSAVSMYGPGIEGLVNDPTYRTLIGIDYLRFQGYVHPLLDHGRLIARAPQRAVDASITIRGARTPSVTVLDAGGVALRRFTSSDRGYVVRAGLTPPPTSSVTAAWDGRTLRWFAMIGDGSTWVDASDTYVGAALVNGSVVTRQSSAEGDMVQWMAGLPAGTPVVMGGIGRQPQGELAARIVQAGVPSTATVWIAAGLSDGTVWTSSLPSAASVASLAYFIPSATGSTWSVAVDLPVGDTTTLLIADDTAIERALVEPAHLAGLARKAYDVDVLYVTHNIHREETERLAAHRRRYDGVRTAIVDIDDVVDEFGAGRRSPEALRAFFLHAWSTATNLKPSYAVLVGNASWDGRLAIKRGNVGAVRPNQVPTYGRPSSDYWFGLLDDEFDYGMPELVIGRLPVLTASEAKAVVDKIIAFDSLSDAPWMRRFFYVGGGNSEQEELCYIYEDFLRDKFGSGYSVAAAPLCLDTITLCRYNGPPNPAYVIREELNRGVQWMNFLGHGATNLFEITGWEPTDLANAGRVGILATYACQTGAYANPSTECKNAAYLTIPDRGFVAAMGGTGWTYISVINLMHFYVHDALATHSLRRLGDILYYAKTPFGKQQGDWVGRNAVMQQCLLGDPLTAVRLGTVPDAYIRRQDVVVVDGEGDAQITEDDARAVVSIAVRNAGIAAAVPFNIRIRRVYGDRVDTVVVVAADGFCASTTATCTLDVAGMVGEHIITIDVDPEGALAEDRVGNNGLTFVLDVLTNALVPVEPQRHWSLGREGAVVRMLDPSPSSPASYVLAIADQPTMADEHVVVRSGMDELTVDGGVIDWTIPVALPFAEKTMWFGGRRIPIDGGPATESWIPVSLRGGTDRAYHEAAFFRELDTARRAVIDDAGVRLRQPRFVVDLLSGSRLPPTLAERNLVLKIGQVTYAENPFFRGFNIALVDDGDSVPRAIRRYDTYFDPDTNWTSNYDGSVDEFLAFMTDSILPTDRVVLVTCLEAFSGFIQQDRMDTMRTLLRRLGSAYADSLDEASCFAMVGRLGATPGSAIEVGCRAPDTMVVLSTTLPVPRRGTVVRSDILGPASTWTSVTLEGTTAGGSMVSRIWGRAADGTEVLLDSIDGGVGTWEATAAAQEYPYLSVRSTLEPVDADTVNPTILRVAANYVPLDELMVDTLVVDTAAILRGDTVRASVGIRNLYRTYTSRPTMARLMAGGAAQDVDAMDRAAVPILGPDERTLVMLALSTETVDSVAVLTADVYGDGTSYDLYRFNNRVGTTLSIGPDAVAPQAIALFDGRLVNDGDFVRMEPYVDVLLLDNSLLPIGDSTRMTIFINGSFIGPASRMATEWEFLPTDRARSAYPDYPGVRAAIRFRTTLEAGQNNLLVRAEDATGNRDTLDIAVYTSDRLRLAAVSVVPNPVTDRARFRVSLAGDSDAVGAVVDIVDVRGRLQRRLPITLRVGTGDVLWDGRDGNGAMLAPGIYHYRMSVDGIGSVPEGAGTLLLLR